MSLFRLTGHILSLHILSSALFSGTVFSNYDELYVSWNLHLADNKIRESRWTSQMTDTILKTDSSIADEGNLRLKLPIYISTHWEIDSDVDIIDSLIDL